MAAADLDYIQLSSFTSLSQSTINALIDDPTTELVRAFLTSVSTKAREYDNINSENLKLHVELENAVRGGETKSRVLKAAVDKSQKECADLRQELEAKEKLRHVTESELEALKSSTSSSASELSDAKVRISSLETSNRDTLALLESKSTAYDELTDEVAAQHQKTVELRREVSNLEQSIQSANAASSNAKYHEQGLQQEIEHLKRSNEWLDNELKTKSADYTKYRKEKGNRIAELQRHNDEAASTIESLNRTEITLRKRLEEVGQKADDSLARIQQMQEEASRKDEAFRIELDAANRLAELMKNSANTEKDRQRDLREQLETLKEDASEQIGRISAEVDTEHREREVAEQRVAELEVQVERLEADLTTLSNEVSGHGSSHRGLNGHVIGTPVRAGSTPNAYSPGPAHIKGGISLTQLYSDNSNLKRDLEAEKRRNEKLSNTIDEMINDLESRQPEVEELRVDHGRLQSDVAEMSSLVDVVGRERDQAVKDSRKKEGQLEAKIKEGEVLRQQLRDLSSQVKMLVMEVHLRDQGVDELTAESRRQLEQVAQGQLDDPADGITDTDRLISENLVTFKNIAQLQEQNKDLIKVTRELGDRMEREEASRANEDQEDLRQKFEQCKDEIKSLVTQSQSYIRERDMFRRMLSHRGRLPSGEDLASMFGESVGGEPPATPSQSNVINSIEQSPTSRELSDYAKLLKDMQSHFDAYRQEAATDRSTLKEQVDSLSKSNGELRSEVGRYSSQMTLAHERYEMLQSNYAMLKSENEELQKRSQFFADNSAKQDLKTQQVVEDLVESKGLADSMRNELAILKAEKDFWKSVEKRITEDNMTFSNERTRLNSLNASLQSLLNEKEHSDTEARRKLSTKVETLERDLQAAKRKLLEDQDENKRTTLRREYETQQSQNKIDDLVSSLSALREEFVAAKTTRDHLQARVSELTIELRSAEERVHLLQPSSGRQDTSRDGQESTENVEEDSMNKEQELGLQVSELRRDLELSRSEIENAQAQIAQYKAISQSSEEQLQSLNETQDLYRQDMDKALEEKTARVQELHSRVEDLTSELSATASELSDLRTKEAESGRRLEVQKSAFETELTQLKDQDERHATAAQFHQEDLKVQAEIAQQAQHNYENELVKHAEAAKALQSVRAQFNEVKIQIVEMKTEAESARAALAHREESWTESKVRYERELSEVKTGKENLNTQNNRLHQQLEHLSGQISNLQKRTSISENNHPDNESLAPDFENLQEVIKYLRREKEIVDVQLELSTQEAKRLKQQLDYTQSQLDDTRLKLNQQRRLEEDNERTAFNHKKLMETINELNTFRESSVTLRNETRQAQAALAAKAKQAEELMAQVEPLQFEVRELRNEKETQMGEMKLLQENCDRWQQRAQTILQKYDRIDPAELEALKGQLQSLETERDDLTRSRQELREKVDDISGKITQAQDQGNEKVEELRQRLTDQFKTRSKNLSAIIKEKDTALQAASKEKTDLEHRFETLHSELKEAEVQRDQAVEQATASKVSRIDTNLQNGSEDGQVDDQESPKPASEAVQALQERLNAAETRASEESSRISNLQNEATVYQSRIAELEQQITQMQLNIDQANAELDQLRSRQQQEPAQSVTSDSEEQLGQLHRELVQAQHDAENMRASILVHESLKNTPAENDSDSVAEQVSKHVEAIRVELENRHNERIDQLEESFKKRSESMRNQLTTRLREGKQGQMAEQKKKIEDLQLEHHVELEKLRTRHQDELDELRRNEESRFATFKESLLAENSAAIVSADTSKSDEQGSRSSWNPTEAEARDFVATNSTVRSILMKNITGKVKEARDQLQEDHEKQLAEVREKAEAAQGHAVFMEGKRSALKLSIAEHKAKSMQPKLDIIQRAAQDTPQKPVSEVWAVAKEAKPLAPAPAQLQQDGSKKQNSTPTGIFGQPTPFSQNQPPRSPFNPQMSGTFGQPTPLISTPGVNSPTTQSNPQSTSHDIFIPIPFQQNAMQQRSSFMSTGSPTPSKNTEHLPGVSNQAPPISQAPKSITGMQPPSQPSSASSASQSNLPMKPPQGMNAQQYNAGTGPGALRGLQQSSLPIARGGASRGAGNSRGRGQGMGRGGPQALDTSHFQGQPHGRGSPTSGLMSGGARQFVPQGNKRPREEAGQDGQSSGEGGNGKRIRGGSHGS